MINWIKRYLKASREARLPPPTTAAESLWNEKTHNQALLGFPQGTAEAVRAGDMQSKAVYDGLDDGIEKMRELSKRLRTRPKS